MSDPISARILGAVTATLKQHVKPDLASPESRLQLDLALRALDFLSARQSTLAEDLSELIAAERRDLADIAVLMREQENFAHAERIDALLGEAVDPSMSLPTLEDQRAQFEAAICEVTPNLMELATVVDATAFTGRAGQLLKNIVASQVQFSAKQDPESVQGSQSIFGGGRIDEKVEEATGPDAIEDGTLTAYLQAKFPEKNGVAATDTRIIPGGYSKRTAFFTMLSDDAPPLRAVIRMDLPGPSDRSVTYEYPLMKALFVEGLPVAEPYWLEADAAWFGGSFMVAAQRPGSNDPAELLKDPVKGEAFGRELAAVLAKLHAVKIEALDPQASAVSTTEYLRREVTRYYDSYRNHKKVPHPLIVLAFSWLLSNLPKEAASVGPSLTHGDIGFHNLLIHDGRLGSVLDWETSHIGDHAEDLYYAKPFVSQILEWDKFLDYYYQNGGKECPASSEPFYRVWLGARIGANCAKIRAAYEDELPEAIAYAVIAYIFGRRTELDAANVVAGFV